MERRRDNLLIVLSDEGLLAIISLMLIHQARLLGARVIYFDENSFDRRRVITLIR
jgi:hypothetical protein